MRAFVTGATGLLGNNLVRVLLERGYNIVCFLRQGSDDSSLRGLDVEIKRGSLLDASHISKAMQGCNVVVHAAARTEQYPLDFKYYRDANVTATKNMIEAAKSINVDRFIYVSTANTFGAGTKLQPGTEWSEFSHFNLGSGYINSKYLAQEIVMMEAERNRFPAIVVNPTFMLGAHDYKPSSGKMVLHALNKPVVFYPSGGKNFVHVRDVAIGIVNAIDKGRLGESYLLAGENLSYFEFFKKVLTIAESKSTLVRLSPQILQMAGRAGDIVSWVKPVALNSVSATLLSSDNYYTANKAVTELQMPQTPIDSAIKDALEFFAVPR